MDSWSQCTALPAKCQAVYGWAGTIRAAKVLETASLSLVPQRVYGMSEVFLTLLCCDTKILFKCIPTRIKSAVHDIINIDQMSYITESCKKEKIPGLFLG